MKYDRVPFLFEGSDWGLTSAVALNTKSMLTLQSCSSELLGNEQVWLNDFMSYFQWNEKIAHQNKYIWILVYWLIFLLSSVVLKILI